MLDLKELLLYDKVFIQCHDSPDPDAIASAFAVSRFLGISGTEAEIVYGGFSEIRKSNLLLMASSLGIPLRYLGREPDEPELTRGGRRLLLIMDGQFGGGNVTALPAGEVAVIDHHMRETEPPALCDIRPHLGSCSTLVWRLLLDAGFDFQANLDVGTALYYGLYTDTNSLSEIVHPLDMDMRDSLRYDAGLIKRLKNSNLTIGDLSIAGKTLVNHWLAPETRSAVFEAEPCDPNILGFTSDLALQVDNIDSCVVFCAVSGGVKISVRSCVREIMANELAGRLCEGVGSGGGHKDKAGGFISAAGLEKQGLSAPEFLKRRYQAYFEGYDLIYAGQTELDTASFPRCRKKIMPVGFVRSSDVFSVGTEVLIRTLEGDTHIVADPDIYVMIGVKQEAYPIRRAKFEVSYRVLDGEYKPDARFLPEERYAPTAKKRVEGVSVDLLPFARLCVPAGETFLRVRRLTKRTKVFTSWNLEGYMFGDVGDYLAVREDDPGDVYVVEREIFRETYEIISEQERT